MKVRNGIEHMRDMYSSGSQKDPKQAILVEQQIESKKREIEALRRFALLSLFFYTYISCEDLSNASLNALLLVKVLRQQVIKQPHKLLLCVPRFYMT